MVKKIAFILLIIPIVLFGRLFKKNTISASDRYEYRTEFTVYFDQNRSSRIPDILKRNFTEKALIENYEIHKEIFNKLVNNENKIDYFDIAIPGKNKLMINLHNGTKYKIRAVTLLLGSEDAKRSQCTPYYLNYIISPISPYSDGSLSAPINSKTYDIIMNNGRGYVATIWWE